MFELGGEILNLDDTVGSSCMVPAWVCAARIMIRRHAYLQVKQKSRNKFLTKKFLRQCVSKTCQNIFLQAS